LITLFFSLPFALNVCAILLVNFIAWYTFCRWGGVEFLQEQKQG
jgi:hypothetical protein